MAIYHFSVRVKSRSKGSSATASAAYISGGRIHDAREGVTHDYSRRRGIRSGGVVLPEAAPAEWQDPARLWNAVEASEKSKNAQLMRSMNAAIPVELSDEDAEMLAQDFAEYLAAQGMCVQWAVHDAHHGKQNPHAHFLVTVRECDERGFRPKARKLYLCRREGEERYMDGADFSAEKSSGWEKVYPFKDGRKLTMSEASCLGLSASDRKGKQPVSRREDMTPWESKDALLEWRRAWEDYVNDSLEWAGINERVDCRSYREQGIDQLPTRHMGHVFAAMERRGVHTDVAESNRIIRRVNAIKSRREALLAERAELEAAEAAEAARRREMAAQAAQKLDRTAKRGDSSDLFRQEVAAARGYAHRRDGKRAHGTNDSHDTYGGDGDR